VDALLIAMVGAVALAQHRVVPLSKPS
jgi:hypothetical protein